MQKLKPENLVASARSPVIPDVSQAEKVEVAKEREEKARAKAERKAERLANEKAEAEKSKAGPEQVGPEQPEAEVPKKKEPKGLKKKKEPKSQKLLEFPVSARINDYGFIGLKKGLLEALDWHKGMALLIDKGSDGTITIRKA